MLLPSAVLYAAALSLLPVLAARHAPAAVLFGCALLAGTGFPPVSGSMKELWPRLVADDIATGTAYAAESLIQQLLLIAPLLATALIVGAEAAAALWTAAAATLFDRFGTTVRTNTAGPRPWFRSQDGSPGRTRPDS